MDGLGRGCGRAMKARGGGIRGSRRGPTWPVRLGILSATGGGRPQGRPRRPGGALRARARAAVLVPVLRPRGAETPEPRNPDRAARGAAGASGQVSAGPEPLTAAACQQVYIDL